ncbi:MAG TPA: metallophosphoesterase, partial [Blastocatellia bacterium]|nr:metallophosphoesterase [Blastocatellia bacterium]
MKIRIGLTGDLHVDAFNKLAPLSDQIRLLHLMLDHWSKASVDLIVVSGDVYERGSVPEEREVASEFLVQAANIAPVVGVKGNHDIPDDVLIFSRLQGRFPIVFAQRPHVITLRNCEVHALPWFDKSPMLARLPAGLSIDQSNQMVIEAGKNLLRTMAARVQETRMKGLIPVAVHHGMVFGSRVSTGQHIRGETIEFHPADWLDVGAAAVLLGHIHKAQQDWDFRVTYPGSPYRTDHGENEAKGFRIIEIEPDKSETVRPTPQRRRSTLEACAPRVENEGPAYRVRNDFIELPARKLTHLTFGRAVTANGLADFLQTVKTQADGQARGANVRIRYHVRKEDKHKVDENEVKRVLYEMGAADVQVEPVLEDETRIRSEAIVIASDDRDRIAAFWSSKGISPDDNTRQRIHFKVDTLKEEIGLSSANRVHTGQIKLLSSEVQGCTSAFRNRVRVDWSRLPDGLIVVTGPNGAGKTTLLDSTHASVYRKFAFRPKGFYSVFQGTEAFAASTWEHRSPSATKTLRTSVQVNAEKRKTEQYFSVNGEKESIKTLEDWFESAKLVLAGPYQCQKNSYALPQLSAAERKEVFAEMLQLDALQEISIRAADRRKSAAASLETARALLAAMEREIACLDSVKGEVKAAEESVGHLSLKIASVRDEESARTRALHSLQSAANELEPAVRNYNRVAIALADARLALEHITNAHDREVSQLTNRLEDLGRRLKPEGADEIVARLQVRRSEMEEQIFGLERLENEFPEIEAAESRLTELRDEYRALSRQEQEARTAQQAIEKAEHELQIEEERFSALQRACRSDLENLKRRAALLSEGPCSASEGWWYQDKGGQLGQRNLRDICPLIADARLANQLLRKSMDPEEPDSLVLARTTVAILRHSLQRAAPEAMATGPAVMEDTADGTATGALAIQSPARILAAIAARKLALEQTAASEGLEAKVARKQLVQDARVKLPAIRCQLANLESVQRVELASFQNSQTEIRSSIESAECELERRRPEIEAEQRRFNAAVETAQGEFAAAEAQLGEIRSKVDP